MTIPHLLLLPPWIPEKIRSEVQIEAEKHRSGYTIDLVETCFHGTVPRADVRCLAGASGARGDGGVIGLEHALTLELSQAGHLLRTWPLGRRNSMPTEGFLVGDCFNWTRR